MRPKQLLNLLQVCTVIRQCLHESRCTHVGRRLSFPLSWSHPSASRDITQDDPVERERVIDHMRDIEDIEAQFQYLPPQRLPTLKLGWAVWPTMMRSTSKCLRARGRNTSHMSTESGAVSERVQRGDEFCVKTSWRGSTGSKLRASALAAATDLKS
jgi:hypothetical protein